VSECFDLIGLRYRLGADGSNGEIDCINLVYRALERMQIPTPTFKPEWYAMPTRAVLRDLLAWGHRVDAPAYDGDVMLIPQDRWAFAVTWQQGILHINRSSERVAWCPLASLTGGHCFRMKGR
jgi:hypothetical protein